MQFVASGCCCAIARPDFGALKEWAERDHALLRDAFGSRLYVAVELHLSQHDSAKRGLLREFSKRHAMPLVAANDVYYHAAHRQHLQDTLVCIREGCTLNEAGFRLFPNGERRLKSAAEISELFGKECDEWIERTTEIADGCRFSLDDLRYEYPEELTPAGTTPSVHLAQLTWDGTRGRWPDGTPDKVRAQIEHELKLIEELRYEAYFLTVHDIVRFARSRDILCQGRGSAANVLPCRYGRRVSNRKPRANGNASALEAALLLRSRD